MTIFEVCLNALVWNLRGVRQLLEPNMNCSFVVRQLISSNYLGRRTKLVYK